MDDEVVSKARLDIMPADCCCKSESHTLCDPVNECGAEPNVCLKRRGIYGIKALVEIVSTPRISTKVFT